MGLRSVRCDSGGSTMKGDDRFMGATTNRTPWFAGVWRCVICMVLLVPLLAPASTRADEINADAVIQVQNMDDVIGGQAWGLLAPNQLTFSRIQCNPHVNPTCNNRTPDGQVLIVHDTAVLRVTNTGTAPLNITGTTVASGWQITGNGGAATVAPGGTRDITIKFTAQNDGPTKSGVWEGELVITSNAGNAPRQVVKLSGLWQSVSEGGQEPTAPQVTRVFGIKTVIVAPGQTLYNGGRVRTVGEEILSPYWKRADASKPVRAIQLAAYHGNDKGQKSFLRWFPKGNPSGGQGVITQASWNAQSVLPRKDGDPNALAAAQFTPSAPIFGFKTDGEWSDPTLNDQRDCAATEKCGHHVRVWPVRDAQGILVPNTYMLMHDIANFNSSTNFDFQDSIYLISNIQPENTPPPMPRLRQGLYRLDTSGTSNYIDVNAYDWTPDTGYFSPANTPVENPDNADIAGTSDDIIYQSYRGKVPGSSRKLVYELPTRGLTKVDLQLHFAERFWTSSGKRVFDIVAEGQVIKDNFDIYKTAGGKNKALKIDAFNIAVNDGSLTLEFNADPSVGGKDYVSVAGIEVLCQNECPGNGTPPPPPGDTTPPASPTGLVATVVSNGVQLNWTANTEPDLAAYNVYRGTSASGTFTKITTVNTPTTQFLDTTAPVGATSFYYIKAVDTSQNESAQSNIASATRSAAGAPLPPTGVARPIRLAGSQVVLDWNDNTDSDLAGYNVYRGTSVAGPFTKLNPALLTTSTFTDAALPTSPGVYYRVMAVDKDGNESAPLSLQLERTWLPLTSR